MNRRKPSRGSVLLLTIFFLGLMFFLALAFTQLLPGELRGATREHLDAQASYTADAAIQKALKDFQAGVVPAVGSSGTLTGDWTWHIIAVDGPVISGSMQLYWVASEARYQGYPRRRSRALIQAGLPSLTRFAYFFDFGMGNTNNPDAAMDYAMSVVGDIYWGGIFRLRNFDRSSSPAQARIQGVVYSTQAQSGTPCGAEYTDGVPYDTVSGANVAVGTQYNKIYRDGVSGVRPNTAVIPFDGTAADDAIQSGSWGTGVLNTLFGNAGPSASGVYVNYQVDGSGGNATAGGVRVNNPLNTVVNVTLRVVDSNGSVINAPPGDAALANGNSETQMSFFRTSGGGGSQSVDGPPIFGVSARPSSPTWFVTEVTNGYTIPSGKKVNGTPMATPVVIPAGERWTVVRNANGSEYFRFKGNTNGAVYVQGDLNVEGVNKGRRTVWGSGTVNIIGELLKAGTVRGAIGTETDTDVLGIGKDYDSSSATKINIQVPAKPAWQPDDNFYLYAALAGLGKADLELDTSGGGGAGSPGSTLWPGARLFVHGSLIQDDSVAGHVQKIFDFFAAFNSVMIIDPASALLPPPFWPGGGTGQKPTLRAYVEQPVSY